MNVLRRLAARRHLRTLRSAGTRGRAEVTKAKEWLTCAGEPLLPAIFELLAIPEARPSAREVLSSIVEDDLLPHFVEALSSPDPAVSAGAEEILAASTRYDPLLLLEAHTSTPAPARPRLERALLARAKDLPTPRLVEALAAAGKDTRGALLHLLDARGSAGEGKHYLPLLACDDWWLRLHALKLLAHSPQEAATEAVTALLKDPNRSVRREAVRALGEFGSPSVVPPLCDALRDDDLKVQTAAIDVLTRIGDASAIPHLLEVLKDEAEHARRGAVEVLNVLATTKAIKDLVTALRDEDWWVRVRAADALGTLGGEQVVTAVLELMKSTDDFLRRYAVEILNAVPSGRAVEPLIAALSDPDWWVRERSIDALAKAGDSRAVGPLLELMGRDPEAAPLCARALGGLGAADAVPALCAAAGAGDEELAREARAALQELSQTELAPEFRSRIREVLSQARDERPRAPRQSASAPVDLAPGDPQPRQPEAVQPRAAGALPAAVAAEPAGRRDAGLALDFQELPPETLLLDRYRIVRQIGRGGFGSVYLARDAAVNEELVLKILDPRIATGETAMRRFVQELRTARRIAHPNVIRIYDFLEIGSAHAISMEYLPSRDLAAILTAERRLAPERGLPIVEQVCEGLAAAHEAGVVHRDIKPGNILVGEGDQVKIVDFGLASVAQQSGSRLTQTGVMIGTPEYMAPEQITGEGTDCRADIYSVGIVMYEMFAGRRPFEGNNTVNLIFKHLEGLVPPLRETAPEVSEDLEWLILQAMARDAADRPGSARELLGLIRALPDFPAND
jgi:HEAT repeat protein